MNVKLINVELMLINVDWLVLIYWLVLISVDFEVSLQNGVDKCCFFQCVEPSLLINCGSCWLVLTNILHIPLVLINSDQTVLPCKTTWDCHMDEMYRLNSMK